MILAPAFYQRICTCQNHILFKFILHVKLVILEQVASHHPIRKKLQDDPHMLGTKNKEHEDKHNVPMIQKNKVGGSKSEPRSHLSVIVGNLVKKFMEIMNSKRVQKSAWFQVNVIQASIMLQAFQRLTTTAIPNFKQRSKQLNRFYGINNLFMPPNNPTNFFLKAQRRDSKARRGAPRVSSRPSRSDAPRVASSRSPKPSLTARASCGGCWLGGGTAQPSGGSDPSQIGVDDFGFLWGLLRICGLEFMDFGLMIGFCFVIKQILLECNCQSSKKILKQPSLLILIIVIYGYLESRSLWNYELKGSAEKCLISGQCNSGLYHASSIPEIDHDSHSQL
ncbi:hypothetical protein CMV_024219 [Castanea mollissima]|uniref:Uncharacterized protein n=1 Tax=Castanea mollissima TaxID=60419 RepID=A0A8J4QN63_9ROSI|nr:hypothetical protein CMV_024219 [Castanea mollissima]